MKFFSCIFFTDLNTNFFVRKVLFSDHLMHEIDVIFVNLKLLVYYPIVTETRKQVIVRYDDGKKFEGIVGSL